MDKRWHQLADLLVNWAVEVKPGEKVMIAMHEVETLDMTIAVYRSVIKAGGFPQVQFFSDYLRREVLKNGNLDQVNWIPEIEAYGMQWADVYFGLRGAHSLYEFSDIPTDRLSMNQRAMGKVSNLRWDHPRWVLVRVPNESFAQQAKIPYETMLDMFFDSSLLDYEIEVKEWKRVADILEKGSQFRILGNKTDLSFSVEGRKWVIGDGRISVPDGEIYTSPVESTIDGTIYYEFPGVLGGRIMNDIQLTWEKGKMVSTTSSTNQEYLREIVATDAGSSLIGEFGFGVNNLINIYTTDILIDEKIGGSIHTALGRAYPICGGTNKSAIHWDIVKDTRQNTEMFLDGKLVFKDGKFTI
jgi:aminopeptidase